MANKYGFRSGKGTFKALQVNGAQFVNTVAPTTTYSTKNDDYIIGVVSSSTGITVTISAGEVVAGRVLIINDQSGNSNTYNITVATAGSEKIDGGDTVTISTNKASLGIYCDGTNWFSF